jgi:hypothetical protein
MWRITPLGEQTLVCPSGPSLSVEDVRDLHAEYVKDGKTKSSLRDWAIEMKRLSGNSSYDSVIVEPQIERGAK